MADEQTSKTPLWVSLGVLGGIALGALIVYLLLSSACDGDKNTLTSKNTALTSENTALTRDKVNCAQNAAFSGPQTSMNVLLTPVFTFGEPLLCLNGPENQSAANGVNVSDPDDESVVEAIQEGKGYYIRSKRSDGDYLTAEGGAVTWASEVTDLETALWTFESTEEYPASAGQCVPYRNVMRVRTGNGGYLTHVTDSGRWANNVVRADMGEGSAIDYLWMFGPYYVPHNNSSLIDEEREKVQCAC